MTLYDEFEHRLSWEMPSSFECAHYEATLGKSVWREVPWDQLTLSWHRTEVVFRGNERIGQYHQLKQWADTKEQPIRSVLLERREALVPTEGWEPVDV